MSVHNRFGAVIAKVGVTIGQNCLRGEIIGVSVFGGDSCSGIEDIASKRVSRIKTLLKSTQQVIS